MKIKYTGPGSFVMVEPHGMHKQGEVKEYPDDFGANLIETSRKQKFEVVDGEPEATSPEDLTIAQLQADLVGCGIEAAALKGMKKADLVALWRSTKDGLSALAG